ncbi:MAG: nuclear transport factor 2 family protein [Nocardioides sp.]
MSDHAATIRRFWETTEARDWDGLGSLLSPDLVFETEQTRERVRGREGLLGLFRGFPGEWHVALRRVVADDGASSVVDATLDGQPMVALTFFTFDSDGRVTRIEEWWPEPYEPPAGRAQLTERF